MKTLTFEDQDFEMLTESLETFEDFLRSEDTLYKSHPLFFISLSYAIALLKHAT